MVVQKILKWVPRSVKDGGKNFLHSKFKWRYIDNFSGLLAQTLLPANCTPEEKRIVSELNTKGIAISTVEKVLPGQNVLENLWEEYERLSAANEEKISEARKNVSGGTKSKSFLFRFLDGDKTIDRANIPDSYILKKIAQSPAFKRISTAYMGLTTRLVYFDLWQALTTKKPPTRSQLWHRDVEDHVLVKIFIYLCDVDGDTGPFCYVEGTHSKGEIDRHPKWFKEPTSGNNRAHDEDVQATYGVDRIRTLTGKKGDIIFADTRGVHKGGLARKKDRVLFKMEYIAKNTDLSKIYGY